MSFVDSGDSLGLSNLNNNSINRQTSSNKILENSFTHVLAGNRSLCLVNGLNKL